ncbi:MAG: ABC transporter permease [Planctomycetes bacterium]|nr:ABC transporter permease [Planctomycetota bacterium]
MEVAARLQRQRADAVVYIVFFGSHHSAEEGARYFYYVADKHRKGSSDSDPLTYRDKSVYRMQLDQVARYRDLLGREDFATSTSHDSVMVRLQLKNDLVGIVNDINYDVRQSAMAQSELEKQLREQESAPAEKRSADSLIALKAAIAAEVARQSDLKASKSVVNSLRGQLAAGAITDQAAITPHLEVIRDRLARKRTWLQGMIAHNDSFIELAQALTGETIVGHLSFEFSSAKQSWMMCCYGENCWSRAEDMWPGALGKHVTAYKAAFESLPPGSDGVGRLWVPPNDAPFRWDALSLPHSRTISSAAAVALGINGFELMTLADPLDRDELPVRGDWDLAPLAPLLADWVRALAADRDLPVKTGILPSEFQVPLMYSASGEDLTGLEIVDQARGSEDVKGIAANAISVVGYMPHNIAAAEAPYKLGAVNLVMARVTPDGRAFMPNVTVMQYYDPYEINVFGFAQDGRLERMNHNADAVSGRAKLFYGFGGTFFTPFIPNDYIFINNSTFLGAKTDSGPKRQFAAWFRGNEVFYQDQHVSFKFLGNGMNVLGIQAGAGNGSGLSIEPGHMAGMNVTRLAGHDYAALNLQRLKALRDRNLVNKSLEKLQADAQEQVELADAARGRSEVRSAVAHETIANVIGSRVHQPLRDNAADLVQAVIILLLLCIPFSFACERLMIGAASIYRQIVGFLGFFLGTFGVLYVTHPAFSLASAPIVIFLAFIIILLSTFVIAVVMSKFKQELKSLQGLSSKVHGGQGDSSTAMAAVVIGISGMRNRPLKTFLTSTTVVLLTFTILVFASFTSNVGIVSTFIGSARGPDRIEFHTPSFMYISDRLYESVSSLYSDHFDMYRRAGSFKVWGNVGTRDEVVNVAFNPESNKYQRLDSMLIIDPAEVPRLDPLFAELAKPTVSGLPPILLSPLVATTCGVAIGGVVTVRGQRYELAGTFDGAVLKRIENADASRMLPPDFDRSSKSLGVNADNQDRMQNFFKNLDFSGFIYSTPDMVGITTFDGMRKLGTIDNYLVMYPKRSDVDVDGAAREIAAFVEGPVCASVAGKGINRYLFSRAFAGSGFIEVLVPLLLGGLIIFSSLLGSIVDRQKEIYTFSALGLAPPDVGALFFAESAVYSVLGGMGGYLISQIVAKGLAVLSAYGLADVPDLNFSSLSSIATILVVMATIMLSTIYPALMAGRSANPGIARKWKMPKPEGDRIAFTFPFTVSAESIGGILAFIREHFDNHGDATLGSFSARDIRIFREKTASGQPTTGISADIALAPFDLGVLQHFVLSTRPSDIAGIDEVVVELTRINGAPSTWLRGNREFINDLRNQFLFWRSLPLATTEHYQEIAARSFGQADAAQGQVEATHG